MKTNLLIKIDELFIKPLINTLNLFIIVVGKILRINHSLENKEFKTIAICKYKGMGSIIQATALLKTLRSNYPNSKIIFISTIGNKAILEKYDCIDKMIFLNDRTPIKLILSLPKFITTLIKYRIAVFIDLEVYSNFSSLITILSLAKNRLGFYLQSKHFRMGNYTHMMYYNTHSPIQETYLQFARLLKCNTIYNDLLPIKSSISKIEINGITIDLEKDKYLVINPNASDLRIERRWGRNKYNQLIKHILSNFNDIKIIVIGGKSEKKYVDVVINDIQNNNLINCAGNTSIDELIALIKNATLVISNDSGPMHVAFACKTPTIGLFGPCHPNQYGINPNGISIFKNLYCSPCVHDFVNPPCRGNNLCMKLIAEEDVFNKVKHFITTGDFDEVTNSNILYQDSNNTIGQLFRN